MVENEHSRALEEIAVERKRSAEEIKRARKRAHTAIVISYIVLGMFVLLFFMDFFIPTRGWIQR